MSICIAKVFNVLPTTKATRTTVVFNCQASSSNSLALSTARCQARVKASALSVTQGIKCVVSCAAASGVHSTHRERSDNVSDACSKDRGYYSQQRMDHFLQTLYSQAAQPRCVDSNQAEEEVVHVPYVTLDQTSHALGVDVAYDSSNLLQEAKNPGLLDFEGMYVQLAHWVGTHASCHVPRNCFDAPPFLSSWVRYVRRLYSSNQLPQWQVDRLNMLGFEWKVDDKAAKWQDTYHQLRRFKAIFGHADVRLRIGQLSSIQQATSEDRRMRSVCNKLSRWLDDQAHAYINHKLSEKQLAQLRALDVTLSVPKDVVQQTVQLQGLNAHERKLLRRKHRAAGARGGARALKVKGRRQPNGKPVKSMSDGVSSEA